LICATQRLPQSPKLVLHSDELSENLELDIFSNHLVDSNLNRKQRFVSLSITKDV
jgi:hypothetical protein